MAYWWVNQGNSYKFEHKEGFIWAPIQNAKDQSFFYWENLEEVKESDIIFSNVDGIVKTIGIALNDCYSSNKASSHANLWLNEGRRVDVEYIPTVHPLSVKEIHTTTMGLWPTKYSPITSDGDRANQGYLFEVPDVIGDILIGIFNIPQVTSAAHPERQKAIKETTKRAIIKARIGQGDFRKSLIKRWSSKCAITDFPRVDLLIASHILPWAISTNEERLDPDNGLLLSPNYNALFDKFLISFSESGEILKSNRISWDDLTKLKIDLTSKIQNLTEGNKKYLRFHQQKMEKK
ncbi:HNH endonuclease [Pedobacter cryoconitis]|uniref:HNH nuclease domain-containing protein n=1 Tax=Pedobacter cryoconitis TaxID=188932 RepID=A0A7X0J2H6_9SPHI|nr:HNH endonuclease [Pedobacter cryoconitis]MBB6499870.1 hypothetical protein [Pedobacter cryoconitis]